MQNDRQKVIAAAVVRTLAEKGARGLSHRAVDSSAGLPSSSTAYYYKTRAALLSLAMDSVLSADLQDAQRLLLADGSVDMDALLAEFTDQTNRLRALARLELFVEAARNPEFRRKLINYRERLAELISRGMGQRSAAGAKGEVQIEMDRFEARLFHRTMFPDDG